MPMATDIGETPGAQSGRRRRRMIAAMVMWPAITLTVPLIASAGRRNAVRLAAAWQTGERYQIGWLSPSPDGLALHVLAAIDVPTRAHGLFIDDQGRLLAVARRPGDWLLRWTPNQPPQWHWMQPGRTFNGHVIASADGRLLFTTETDLENDSGMLAVRDAHSLALLQAWPTHGRDPHQLVLDRFARGRVIVANGGIETRPETGRVKHGLNRMDSSLVRLDFRSGRLEGQWRLEDSRLSLRHLAWSGDYLGIALQAEHDDAARRAAAPVLAVFDGSNLSASSSNGLLAGYGGDIAGIDGGFEVGCPRAGGVARFDHRGVLRAITPIAEACALAGDGDGGTWVGGHPQAAYQAAGDTAKHARLPELRLDNHWVAAASR